MRQRMVAENEEKEGGKYESKPHEVYALAGGVVILRIALRAACTRVVN